MQRTSWQPVVKKLFNCCSIRRLNEPLYLLAEVNELLWVTNLGSWCFECSLGQIVPFWIYCPQDLTVNKFLSLLKAAAHQKYSKWKAAYIHKCLKNGETPIPGPAGGDGEEEGGDPPYPPLPSNTQQPPGYPTSTQQPPGYPTNTQQPPYPTNTTGVPGQFPSQPFPPNQPTYPTPPGQPSVYQVTWCLPFVILSFQQKANAKL